MALEHTRKQNMEERSRLVERVLPDVEERGGRHLAEVGHAGAAVDVDREVCLFAEVPQRLPVRVIDLVLDPRGIWWIVRQEQPTS